MARTRAHRRRQTLRIALALVVTFVVLVFGREVSRSAHHETAARLSENVSFAQMADTLLAQENSFDADLENLLTSGATLSRVAAAARLSVMNQELGAWRDTAHLIERPVLSPPLNLTLANETTTRVNAYAVVLAYLAQALALPGPAVTLTSSSLATAQSELLATAAAWGGERHQLAGAPGAVTLSALRSASASLDVPPLVQALVASPSLAPSRAIEIAAIEVQPAPFPAPALSLELAPTTTMTVQVAVTNLREIIQPVAVSMTFTPATGGAQQVSASQTLSPMTSFAFASHTFAVFPGEKGTLRVTLNAVPASPGLLHSRAYAVNVSSSAVG